MKNYTAILMILALMILTGQARAGGGAAANDSFANAITLIANSNTGAAEGTNADATKEAGEPNHAGNAGGKSLWYKYTPAVTKPYRIRFSNTAFDTLLAVYTGGSVNNLQIVTFNDDDFSNNGTSQTDVMMVAGTTYYIAVDGYNNGVGAGEGFFVLNFLELNAPLNDNFANIKDLGNSPMGNVAGTNFAATREANEPQHYSSNLIGEDSVWFKWKSPDNYSVKFELTEDFGSTIAVYTSNVSNPTFAQLNSITENYDGSGFINSHYRAEFFAESNRTYYIAVAGHNLGGAASEGNFQLKFGKNPLRYSADYERYDDRAAIALFRPADGNWYSISSVILNLPAAIQWGQTGDTPVAADYDGNGVTNYAIARSEGAVKNWYIRTSSGGVSGLTWGLAGDRAITGDFDGDGRADVGVMRLTANGFAWYIRQSSTGALRSFLFGTTGDKPVFGDFDGDGKTEVAVTRNTANGMVWYMLKSSTNYNGFSAQQFGTTPDVPVAEDYDGDGKSDIAVFRPSNGTWYILQSSTGALDFRVFGQSGDKPQPADYNGDGKADVAVFRSSNGTWYIAKPTGVPAQNFHTIVWGAADDIPVSSMTTLSQ